MNKCALVFVSALLIGSCECDCDEIISSVIECDSYEECYGEIECFSDYSSPGAVIQTDDVAELIPATNYTYLGSYELTAYEWTGRACANGNYPTSGYTVACNSLDIGTKIYIDGYGEYVVEDRGGMSGNVIDVYLGDYDSCIQFGRRTANVYIIE